MKAKSKSELAANAGISLNTLRSWCNDCREELVAIGWRPTIRVLPPNIGIVGDGSVEHSEIVNEKMINRTDPVILIVYLQAQTC